MPMPPFGRSAVFTVNNPVGELPEHPQERYVVWQLEKVTTEHWQGYAEFRVPVTFKSLKDWLPTAHFEKRQGTPAQARAYCMKEDSRVAGPWERGAAPMGQGKRMDLEELKEAIRAGTTKRELYERFSEAVAKYPRFVADYTRLCREEGVAKVLDFTPKYPWQQKILDVVSGDVDPRALYWVYDPVGNHGKTYLATHLVDKYGAFYTNGGKAVDLTYAYEGQSVVIFDYVRDARDYVGYGVIEQLKNGILMSTKYESGMKRFDKPHVLVFANFMPCDDKFSADRLRVIELTSRGDVI